MEGKKEGTDRCHELVIAKPDYYEVKQEAIDKMEDDVHDMIAGWVRAEKLVIDSK